MKLRFSLLGVVFWALGAFLIISRGFRFNFVIPIVVGTVIFFYGLLAR